MVHRLIAPKVVVVTLIEYAFRKGFVVSQDSAIFAVDHCIKIREKFFRDIDVVRSEEKVGNKGGSSRSGRNR